MSVSIFNTGKTNFKLFLFAISLISCTLGYSQNTETTVPTSTVSEVPTAETPTLAVPSEAPVTNPPPAFKSSKPTEDDKEDEPEKLAWTNPQHSSESLMGIKEGWFIGIDAGPTLFYGDVTTYNIFPKLKDFKKSAGRAYSLYFGKKFKFGLSAEAQGSIGSLTGEKIADKLYPRYFVADIIDYSLSVKYNLTQMIFRETQGRKFFNRFTVYATAGGGQLMYRSRLYKYANNGQWYLEKTNSFTTASIDSASATSGGGLVTDKTKYSSVGIIPVGVKFHFKLNAKTDIGLDVRYITVLSDNVDSWNRDWSHQDKYMYMAAGLVYNLGSTDEDIPDEQKLFKKHKKSKTKADDGYSGIQKTEKKSLFGNGKKSAKEDKDLEIKLKLYELQLKMFEMQYMLTK